MDENKQDESQVLETEIPEAATEENADEALTPEQITELKEKAARTDEAEKKAQDLEAKNKQLFERAKKKPATDGLTPADALVLAKADVHEDDLETVLTWAAFTKASVKDALKDETLRTVLATRNEERKTAAATQTGPGARGKSNLSGEDLLQRAETTGEVPDTTEGMQALFNARMARKIPKRR